jgi:NADPH2:quinone reductase
VRIAVKAAGAYFPDLLMTRGGYQLRPDLPFVPGMEAAGDVIEVGSDVTSFKPGDRVMAQLRLGGFAEQAVMAATQIFPLPDALTYDEGAAWSVAATTACHALHDTAKIQPGETLLVLGAQAGLMFGALCRDALPGLAIEPAGFALVGMAAFEDRRLVLDLGGPGLFVSRPMEITVGR